MAGITAIPLWFSDEPHCRPAEWTELNMSKQLRRALSWDGYRAEDEATARLDAKPVDASSVWKPTYRVKNLLIFPTET